MRFAAAIAYLLAVEGFQHPTSLPKHVHDLALRQSTTSETEKPKTKKEERLRMFKSDQFHRKGFAEVREGVEGVMNGQFKGQVVEDLRQSNYIMERDGVKVYLAKVSLPYRPFVTCLTTFVRTLVSVGGLNEVSHWRMKLSSTFPIARYT